MTGSQTTPADAGGNKPADAGTTTTAAAGGTAPAMDPAVTARIEQLEAANREIAQERKTLREKLRVLEGAGKKAAETGTTPEDLQARVRELESGIAERDRRLTETTLRQALDEAWTVAGGNREQARLWRAVRDELVREGAVKVEDGKVSGVKDALARLRTEAATLFATPAPQHTDTGAARDPLPKDWNEILTDPARFEALPRAQQEALSERLLGGAARSDPWSRPAPAGK